MIKASLMTLKKNSADSSHVTVDLYDENSKENKQTVNASNDYTDQMEYVNKFVFN